MEERLARANAALMRTFQGDSSNALQELRSYRVPPRITFLVLQVRTHVRNAKRRVFNGLAGERSRLMNWPDPSPDQSLSLVVD